MSESPLKGTRAVVFGTQSFFTPGTKTGSQYIAEQLALAGCEVDYIPSLSSPVDVISPARWARFYRAWGPRPRGESVSAGLVELAVAGLLPPHRWFVRSREQLEIFRKSLPSRVFKQTYEICISDICPNMLFVEAISASVKVCRVNDWPWGFASDIHEEMIKELERCLKEFTFTEVWAVSNPLVNYARLQLGLHDVRYFPNGVDISVSAPRATVCRRASRKPKGAVYVGTTSNWFDSDLVTGVAKALPDWDFSIHGALPKRFRRSPGNLNWKGPIARDKVPEVLSENSVGLIPFKDLLGRMAYVERPLKFYEYVAAGLGVACTDVGALGEGMKGFARLGNGVQGFASAITSAGLASNRLDRQARDAFIVENSWGARGRDIVKRLSECLRNTPSSACQKRLD